MSLSNEINAVMGQMDVATARDCVLALRRKYSDCLTFIAEQDHPAVHQEVTALTRPLRPPTTTGAAHSEPMASSASISQAAGGSSSGALRLIPPRSEGSTRFHR